MDENGEESTEELHFFYDAQSKPAFVEYDGVMYRYVHNLQGDIVAIVDTDGNLVVEYKYDAWGKSISTTGSLKTTLGELNPFGYRGYVWDNEVELYYLKSRYLSTNTCRFINMDASLPALKRALSQNVFSYCRNNAINYSDQNGYSEQSFNIPEETIFIDSTLSSVNVLLLVYVPDKEDIDNGVIGHFELAIEYNDQWLVYSYGIGKVDSKDPEVYSALLKVRERADWGQGSGIHYTRYAFGFRASEEQIENGIRMMGVHTGKGEFAIPKVGKYSLTKESGFATYSLNKEKGNVCRDYVAQTLLAIGIDFLESTMFKNDEAYYPTGFMNIIKRQLGIGH